MWGCPGVSPPLTTRSRLLGAEGPTYETYRADLGVMLPASGPVPGTAAARRPVVSLQLHDSVPKLHGYRILMEVNYQRRGAVPGGQPMSQLRANLLAAAALVPPHLEAASLAVLPESAPPAR
jgi:hypothetical protein